MSRAASPPASLRPLVAAALLLVGCYGGEPAGTPKVTPSPATIEAPEAALAGGQPTGLQPGVDSGPFSAGEMVELGELGLIPMIFQALDEGGQAAECDFDDPFDMCQ